MSDILMPDDPGRLPWAMTIGELLDKAVEAAAGIAKNRAEGVANIKQMLTEHTGLPLEEQFRNEVDARSGRFQGLSVEDGFKDFLERKGRKLKAS